MNDIDMSTLELLAKTDAQMIEQISVLGYLGYIVKTVSGKGAGSRVNRDE